MKTPYLFLLAMFIPFMFSCKKNEKEATLETKTALLTRAPWVIFKEELLIDGSWKLEVLTLDGIVLTFRTDGTYKLEKEGQVGYFSWQFTENETKIIMTNGNPPLRAITNLTKDELQMTCPPTIQGEPEERYTFVH